MAGHGVHGATSLCHTFRDKCSRILKRSEMCGSWHPDGHVRAWQRRCAGLLGEMAHSHRGASVGKRARTYPQEHSSVFAISPYVFCLDEMPLVCWDQA